MADVDTCVVCSEPVPEGRQVCPMCNVKICSICGKPYYGESHLAFPAQVGLCCNDCNVAVAIPSRLSHGILIDDLDDV